MLQQLVTFKVDLLKKQNPPLKKSRMGKIAMKKKNYH